MIILNDYYRNKTKRTAETVELFLVCAMIVAIGVVVWLAFRKVYG